MKNPLRLKGDARRLIARPLLASSFQFANSVVREALDGHGTFLVNEAAIGDDGWAQLAPFGDFPGECIQIANDGKISKWPAVQRLDRAVAQAMVDKFHSLAGRVARIARWTKGLPIFLGHPDQPGIGDDYPDKAPKGMISDLAVRADGLYGRPVFNNDGERLLTQTSGLAFSARWDAVMAGEEGGKKILRPSALLSAGLTQRPNLPVQAINEKPMPSLIPIIQALRKFGLSLDDAADETAIAEAIAGALGGSASQLGTAQAANEKARTDLASALGRITALEGELSAERTKAGEAATQVANERSRIATLLINDAITAGRIPEADRNGYVEKFAANFANAERDLAAVRGTPLKTKPAVTGSVKATEAAAADTQGRQHQALQLVNERMKGGESYDDAFAFVMRDRPDLFGMEKPAAK